MKKRLRKKLRLREFRYTGFAVCLVLNLPDNDDIRHSFWIKLETAIEAQGLYVIGRADDFWILTNYNVSPIPAIKAADSYWIKDWLIEQPEVASYRVSALSNNWTPCYEYSKPI